MQIDLSRFRETFFEEAAEHLASLENGLLELQDTGGDKELLNAVFRAAHSIKGGAGSFGLDEVARFTHAMEGLLDRLRAETLSVTPDLVTLLLSAVDVLKELVAASKQGRAGDVEMDSVLGELQRVLAGGAPAPATAPAAAAATAALTDDGPTTFTLRFAPKPGFFFGGQDPLLLLRDLAESCVVQAVRADLSALPPLEELDPEHAYLAWELRLTSVHGESTVRDVFMFVDDACTLELRAVDALAATPAPAAKAAAAPAVPPAGTERRVGGDRRAPVATLESSSIRVATDKVDALVDLLGELVIAQAMVNDIVDHFAPHRLGELRDALGQLDRNTRDLQERVMKVRMLPVATVFNRFPRLVHDLSQAFGKEVRLDLSGSDIELDKGVIERLSDPLTHLIRNSVDHGIESADVRERAGKPRQGVIGLRAYHEGGNVILEVADDGGGLDTERIRAKAIAQGLLGAEDQPSEEQLHAVIFEPGFSTARTVTDVSGRGVGMDVVKRNVQALNGTVTVRSAAGRGTTFRVRLPLTLAILDGLTVRVAGQTYVIPLLSIVESLRPTHGEVKPCLGRGELLHVRGEVLPFVRLSRVFDLADAVQDAANAIVMVLEGTSGRFGVLVDDVLGQAQVVVKNLEAHYRKVEGVMGATIMGDGRVALILDVHGLASLALRGSGPERAEPASGAGEPVVLAAA